MAQLNPVRAAKHPIGTSYVSSRLDEHQVLAKNGNFYKKLERIKHLRRNNFLVHAVESMQKTFVTAGGLWPLGVNELRRSIWEGWCKLCDIEQTKNFTEVLNDICGEMVIGDCLVILRTAKKSPKNRVSSFIDIVQAGRVRTPPKFNGNVNPQNGNKVILGVEFSDGVEVGYWVLNDENVNSENYVFVPRYNEKTGRFISLLMRNPESPAKSVRGSSLVDSVVPEVEDYADLADSSRQGAITKNSLPIILETDNPKGVAQGFGAVDENGIIQTDVDSKEDLVVVGKLPTGSIMSAPAGFKAHTISHSGNIDLQVLRDATKHDFATGVFRPYEILFNDYSGVNFSAGKLLHDPFGRSIEMWRVSFVRLCQEVFQAVTDEGLLIRGISPITIDRRVTRWVGSARTEADEGKATDTALKKVAGGFMSPSEYHAKNGTDYKDVLARYKEDIELEESILGHSHTKAILATSPQNKHLYQETENKDNDNESSED